MISINTIKWPSPIVLFQLCLIAGSSSYMTNIVIAAKLKKQTPIVKSVSPDFEKDFHKFCFNNNDAARDAKYVWQAKKLKEMDNNLKKVIVQFEKKQVEYKKWVERREAFVNKMTLSLVEIYSIMEPETAAAQIALVDYETAISILIKLKPREASAILNEMPPKRASRLVSVIVGSTKSQKKGK